MTLDEFVSQGWQDHAADAAAVMSRFPQGLDLVTEPKHLPALAGLVVHVAGEHLGRFDEGIRLLGRLERLPLFDPSTPEGKAVARSLAVLHTCAGNATDAARWTAAARTGGGTPEDSDRVRILAVAASALAGQKRLREAAEAFDEALALAKYGPGASDPAAKALAITGNGLACTLEESPARTPDETALMLRAAEASLRFWAVAGGWTEVERAEYRLAMSSLKAGDARSALGHAEACLRIVEENGSDPFESFFAREVLSLARLASADRAGARRDRDAAAARLPSIDDSEGNRSYCAGELAKLDAALGPA